MTSWRFCWGGQPSRICTLCPAGICPLFAAAELLSAAAAEIAVKRGFRRSEGGAEGVLRRENIREELAERVAKSGEKLYQVLTGPEMCENIGLTVRIGEAALEKNGCRKRELYK